MTVPTAWYDQFEIKDKYRIRTFVPDFIFVHGDGRHRTLRIIDAKAAKGTTYITSGESAEKYTVSSKMQLPNLQRYPSIII
jgi:hypothetical protein